MITQGPYTLTLDTTLPLEDPGATSNNPATAVQLQNGTSFIIDVNVGGSFFTIQSFTAQTVPTAGGGQQMSVTPIEATSGSGGSLTVVWLLAGESSPMVDGSLTAAAITAAFPVPTQVFPVTSLVNGGANTINVPPTTRTLIFVFSPSVSGVTPKLDLVGNTTGIVYYNNFAYVGNLGGAQWYIVVPVPGFIDTSFTATVTWGSGTMTMGAYADTNQYDESVFYNGVLQVVSGSTPTTGILVGPDRLLTASLACFPGSPGPADMTIQSTGVPFLYCDPGQTQTISFPPNTILTAGQVVQVSGNSGDFVASLTYAYP